jgi:uncharacterized protein (DUF1800 family)
MKSSAIQASARLESFLAQNRFGLGATREGIDLKEPREWLKDQLKPKSGTPSSLSGVSNSATALQLLRDRQQARRQANGNIDLVGLAMDLSQGMRQNYVEAVHARFATALTTPTPFRERLVHFWSNHFAVSADKLKTLGLAHTLENEVIRPGLDGSFASLLRAVVGHPAMLLYLDNERSAGENAPLVKRAHLRGRDLGLNENLAREVLELHTLGVRSGYTQADVTEFARALTGWSISGTPLAPGTKAGQFHFYALLHEPGPRQVLGKRYAQEGIAQAEAILQDLAHNKATAQHIATKLARHFIADEPPNDAITVLTQVFQDTRGDLPSLHAALVDLDQAWRPDLNKIKTPWEFLVSSLRLLGGPVPEARTVVGALQQMGQMAYMPGSPAGWPDVGARWLGSDALMKRIEAANAIANRVGNALDPLVLADQTLGPLLPDQSKALLAQAESRTQSLTLLLSSPSFLRR